MTAPDALNPCHAAPLARPNDRKGKALYNAIVPQVAAEILGAYLDCAPWQPPPY